MVSVIKDSEIIINIDIERYSFKIPICVLNFKLNCPEIPHVSQSNAEDLRGQRIVHRSVKPGIGDPVHIIRGNFRLQGNTFAGMDVEPILLGTYHQMIFQAEFKPDITVNTAVFFRYQAAIILRFSERNGIARVIGAFQQRHRFFNFIPLIGDNGIFGSIPDLYRHGNRFPDSHCIRRGTGFFQIPVDKNINVNINFCLTAVHIAYNTFILAPALNKKRVFRFVFNRYILTESVFIAAPLIRKRLSDAFRKNPQFCSITCLDAVILLLCPGRKLALHDH